MADFDLAQLTVVEAYQLVTRIVAPRPIALVSSLSASGIGNLAPFSYFMMGGSNPPSCVICPLNSRTGEPKDTAVNIAETGEYVINVVTRAMAERMNQCSYAYPPTVDELDRSGLTRAPATLVKPPRVAESPIHLECKLFDIVSHGSGPLASSYIIGEIVLVHVSDGVLTEGLPDDRKIDFIGRLGADWYTHVTAASLFELPRPDKA